MTAPPLTRLERWSQAIFRQLHAFSAGCGALPLVAAGALALASGLQAYQPLPTSAAPVVETMSEDAQVIDAVLAKRAPDLGLTLRRQLGVAIAEESVKAGYDPLLILAIIDVESDFEEKAVSHKGASGLMQITPGTLHFLAAKQGLKLSREEVARDTALTVRLGIRYLRQLHDRFGDLDLALMGYNAGPAKIRRAMKKGVLEDFRIYPRLVRRDFKRFREGEGLGGDWALALRSPLPMPDVDLGDLEAVP